MCDLVIMADHAKFIEVFARRGLVPDAMGTWIPETYWSYEDERTDVLC